MFPARTKSLTNVKGPDNIIEILGEYHDLHNKIFATNGSIGKFKNKNQEVTK